MDKILIICYVCAGFRAPDGQMFFVKPEQRGVFIEAPAWIADTNLFRGLVNDGSLKVAEKQISKKKGENDPMEGIGADGKAEKPEEPVEEPAAEPVKEEKPEADPEAGKLIKTRKTTKSRKAE